MVDIEELRREALEGNMMVSKEEWELCAILIVFTLGTEPPFSIDAAVGALSETYGYERYRAFAMVSATLDLLGSEPKNL